MFHVFNPLDDDPAKWSAFRDWMLSYTAGHYAVSPTDPTAIGITPLTRWAVSLRASRYHVAGEPVSDLATTLALVVDGLTAAGKHVYIHDLRPSAVVDAVPLVTRALELIDAPTDVTVEIDDVAPLDQGPYPLVTVALALDVGIALPVRASQLLAEESGDIVRYIDGWYQGPASGRMPYLLRKRLETRSGSHVSLLFSVNDYEFPLERRGQLSFETFLDLLIHRAYLRMPLVLGDNLGSIEWDSSKIVSATRASVVADIFDYYTNGRGADTFGARRYFAGA